MAGAVWTTKYLPALLASSTLSISLFSINAPVGQTFTHCPHKIHGLVAKLRFSAGDTIVEKPRFSKPKIPVPCAATQRLTQRPHKIHFEVSRIIDGEISSTVIGVFEPTNLFSRAPTTWATYNNSQWPFFSHCWQFIEWLERINSTLARLAAVALGEEIVISIPSEIGYTQDATRPLAPVASTKQTRQEAKLHSPWL